MFRLATFNLENLDGDEVPPKPPTLAQRAAIMQPQLARVAADVICFQEVHCQTAGGVRSLSALDTLLAESPLAGYHRAVTRTTGGDLFMERNLVTLSRFPILETRVLRDSNGPRPSYQMATANPPDTTATPLEWERPLLYTRLDAGGGRVLHVINAHLKSKLPASIPGGKINNYMWKTVSAWAEGSFIASMKRVGQALQIRLLIDQIFDADSDAEIAVCGDLNSTADDVPVRAICGNVEETGNPDHSSRVMIPCENNVPESSRFSLYHLGKGQMLDHILISRPMLAQFDHTEIHNEALPDESGAFRTDVNFPESDHAPVVAEFR